MRKAIVILFVTCTFCLGLNGQSVISSDELYSMAIKKHVLQLDSFYFIGKAKNNVLYIERQRFIDSIPRNILAYTIELIEEENWKSIYRENNNSIIHHKIRPFTIIDDQVEITIIPYRGMLKDNNDLHLELSDWTKVIFEFYCDEIKWNFENVINGGI